MHCNN